MYRSYYYIHEPLHVSFPASTVHESSSECPGTATPTISNQLPNKFLHTNDPTATTPPTVPAKHQYKKLHLLNHFSNFNVQGLKPKTVPSKVPYVQDLLIDQNQLFITLTETWLKDHTDAEININGYRLFRSDRIRKKKSTRGRDSGGVAIYVRSDLGNTMEPLLQYSDGHIEVLCTYSKHEQIFIATIYRQPDDPQNNSRSTSHQFGIALNALRKCILDIGNIHPNIIVTGDFNLPHVSWPYCVPRTGATSDEKSL